jgi:ABC-type uncharacterized transport system substrate-binding protein
MAKRLELLKEAIPHVTRVGVFLNPTNPLNRVVLEAMESTASTISIKIYQDLSSYKNSRRVEPKSSMTRLRP